MPVFNNQLAGAAGQSGGADAYTIQRSVRFNEPDGAYMDITPSSQGNRRQFTWSGWVKRNGMDSSGEDCFFSAGNNPWFDINFRQDKLSVVTNAGYGGTGCETPAVFRDPSAWYHIVCVVNTEESTALDRIKLWVNGVRQTTQDRGSGLPAQHSELLVNSTIKHRLGADGRETNGIRFGNVSLADVHFLDGIAISNPDGVFGEFNSTTGVWDPIEANITSPNDGTTWSSTLTATSAHSSGNPASYGFDGIPSASDPNTFLAGAGGDCVWDASSYGFTNVVVEVYVFGSGGSLRQWQVNGGTAINEATSAGWQNLGTYSTLSEIRCNGVGGGYGGAISAIRLNGITLVDGAKAHGKNGYHLDFSDTSSNAALGTDSSGANNSWNINNLIAAQFSPTITTGGDPTSSNNSPFSTGDRYSVDFDGNDKLTMPGPGRVAGDYTMECFVKASNYNGFQRFFSANEGVNAGQSTMLRCYNGNHEFYHKAGVSHNGTALPTNQWNHLAMTRSGSTVSYYMNGSRLGTATNSDAIHITTLVVAHGFGQEYFTGEVSNARFVDGQALYTGSSYTVPTLTLTTTSQGAIADNVRALCCHQNTVTGVEGVLSSADVTDSLLDSPTNYDDGTNVGGNFATLSPLANGSGSNLTNGCLDITTTDGSYGDIGTTIAPSSGKFYVEFTIKSDADRAMIGIASNSTFSANTQFHTLPDAWAYYSQTGVLYNNSASSSFGDTFGVGDVIGIALDKDNDRLYFSKNGTFQNSGNPSAGTGGIDISSVSGEPSFIMVNDVSGAAKTSVAFNAGQRPYATSSVPTGFKSLCTQNLDAPIEKSSEQFDIALWTGDSANSRTIPTDHEPEFVWVRNRGVNGRSHYLYDALRGFGANKELVTDDTNEEGSSTHLTQNHGYVSGTTASGFTLAAGATNSVYTNESGQSYVGWVWNAASSTTSVSAGSLNSSAYNQSQNWSALGTGDSSAPYNWEATFDGSSASYGAIPPNGQSALVDFSSLSGGGISYTSSVVVTYNRNSSAPDVTVNGSAIGATADGTDRTYTLSGSGTLTSVGTQTRTVAGAGDCAIKKIVVDGKELVDQGVTPAVNVPSQACTQRANPTAGFSIVNYVGTNSNISISHGLSKPPEFIVIKSRDSTQPWVVGHKGIGWTHYLHFSNAIAQPLSLVWQDTAPTSSVFTVGATGGVNANNENMLALCWHSVEGFSKFGSYIGTGSDPGTFQYTGFKVRHLWLKTADTGTAHWYIYDSERDPINITDQNIVLDLNGTEGTTSNKIDLLSNGWIPRSGGTSSNLSGRKYVWAAFAENPLRYARAH